MKAAPTWWDPQFEDKALEDTMRGIYTNVGRGALQTVADDLGRIVFRGATQSILNDLLTYGGERIVDINARTLQALTVELAEGTRRGYSIPQLIDGVPEEGYRGVLQAGLDNGVPVWDELRAETIARTETMLSYNRATVTGYGEFGVTHLLAYDGDDDAECAERNGQEFTVEEALGIEDHPNGTLVWSPVVENRDQEEPEEGEAAEEAPTEPTTDEPPAPAVDLGTASLEEQQAWMDQHYPESSLLKPDLVAGYTGGEDYAYMNSWLRGYFEPATTEGFFAEKPGPSLATLTRRRELMDAELRNGALTEDTRLYRSLSIDWEAETSPINTLFGGAGDVGASGIDAGFVSTSLRADIQEKIAGEYLMVIDAPAGTPAVGAANVSSHASEMEVILGRDLTYTVYARDGDTIFVKVTQ